jgi:hypothetical protein
MLYNWQINQNKEMDEGFSIDENLSTKREPAKKTPPLQSLKR